MWKALLVLPLFFYCALPTRNFYWDGVAIAITIEQHFPAASMTYPSHLLYTLWGAGLYRVAGSIGIPTRALFVMQAANCVLAGACVWLLYGLLRLRGVKAETGVFLALIFAFSATWWRFACDANAYIPAIFFILVSCILMERQRVVWAGLALAGGMVFHELAFLFLPVALVRLRNNRRGLWEYAIAALVPVTAGYASAYLAIARGPTPGGLAAWITAHSADSGFSFRIASDAALTMRGTLRLFFGGKVGDLAGDAISDAAVFLLVFAAGGWLVSLWRMLRIAWRGRDGKPLSRIFASSPRYLWLWLGIYLAFLFFWMPQNTFYRLFYLPPLILIPAIRLPPAPSARWAVYLFAPVIFLWNFAFVSYPQSRSDFNTPLRFALEHRDRLPPGTPVVFSRFHPDLWTISYFNPQAIWIGSDTAAGIEHELEFASTQKQPLWLEETAYQLVAAEPAGRRWLDAHEVRGETLEFKDDKHDFRFHCLR